MGLARAFPDIRDPLRPLVSIPGAPPRLDQDITGCAFAPRCPFVQPRCVDPVPVSLEGRHRTLCWRTSEAERLWRESAEIALWTGQARVAA